MNIGHIVGKRIQELLFKNNMSVYKLAKITNLSEQTITNLIKGNSKNVKISTLYIISNAFNIDLLEFISTDDFKNENIDI